METPKPHPRSELIKAWADGFTIQYRSHESLWVDCDTMPNWDSDSEYRIKPSNKPWMPKKGELYHYVDTSAEYTGTRFDPECQFDRLRVKCGNCFRTSAEAKAAAKRVKAALKGTDVSGNVGSPAIDGKPLSEQEIHLVRQYRDRVAENWKDAGFFWITGPEMDLITSLRLMRNNHGFPEQEASNANH